MSEIKQHTSVVVEDQETTSRANLIESRSNVKIYPESPKMSKASSDSKAHPSKENDLESQTTKIKLPKNYLMMEEDELIEYGITGCRLNLARSLRSKPFDISMIVLILLYCIIIFLIFGLVDSYFSSPQNTMIFYIIELVILGIFCLESFLHVIALGKLYMRDCWNVVDMIIIILSLIFVFLDLFITNSAISGFLKIRGFFRLLRIFLLIRKLNTMRVKRDAQKKRAIFSGVDLRSPLERVLEILNDLRDQIDSSEERIMKNLNYCIQMISSNQLYEAKLDFDNVENKDVMMLVNTYSKSQTKDVKSRRSSNQANSHFQSSNNIGATFSNSTMEESAMKTQITTLAIENALKLNNEAKQELSKVEENEFNIFKLEHDTMSNELVAVTTHILAKENIFQALNLSFETFLNFMERIQNGYKDVTYHNKTHGADLSQTFYYFTRTCGLYEKCKMDDLELSCLIIAGACHDHEHPGFNNVYLIEAKDPIAIRYNDVSVLENHHVASSFNVMQEPNHNILENLSKDDYKRARHLMINSILGTDMSKHFSELGKFKTRVGALDFDPQGQDKDMTMFILFHLADISNSSKSWEICSKWTDLLFIEFFHQGDLERIKGVPITYLMDRAIVNIAKSQIGFYDFIVTPGFTAASQVINIETNLANIESNKLRWTERFDEYEEKMKKDKERLSRKKSIITLP